MNSKKIAIICHVLPEPKSSAAGTRMMQLIHLFSAKSYQISLLSAADNLEFSENLTSLNIDFHKIKLNDDSFDALIKKINPGIVLFDRFMTEEQYGWRVRHVCPKAITVLDTEDLHFLRKARQEVVKNNLIWNDDFLFSELAQREIGSILRCDLSLIISEFELDLLINIFHVSSQLLLYLPFLLEENCSFSNEYNFENRSDFLFVGNCFHEPNLDAIQQLKKEIWPRIKTKIPNAKMYVYGAYMPEKILQLQNENERFYCLGRVEDVNFVMKKAKVFLAPLRFGAGQKGKLLECMLNQLPNVTTSVGAESMHGNLPWNGEICDNWDEFTSAAVKLYTKKDCWQKSVKNGERIINERYLKPHFKQQLIQKLKHLNENLLTHRKSHFVGQILQNNFHNSSKYMSKWIVEKNRLK